MSDSASPDVTEALGRLEAQLDELQTAVRRLGETDAPTPMPAAAPTSYAWVGALEAPARRRPQVPRFLLETLFLAAAAAAAAIADLDAVAIAGVMVGAWVLVALIEWAASRADLRQELPAYAPAPAVPPGDDPAWFSPPVEQTLLDAGATSDPVTAVTRLPPRPDEVEETMAGSAPKEA